MSVVHVCPNCGEENPERFRLCGFCGTPLAVQPPRHEARKTVTVVFSDLAGSTALGEMVDSEAVREVLHVYFAAMKTVLERHGGTVEKFIGDAIMAVFGLDRVHEDDALRAVRAAHEMRDALAQTNQHLETRWGVRLANRTGVNTGEVVSGEPAPGQRLVTGDAVNVAARLQQAAAPLETLIGEATYRLVRDAVQVEAVAPLELRGKSRPVPAYRLLGVRRSDGVARRADTPLVGRTEELAELTSALERAGEARAPELVTVIAPAGAGKSRLLHEFLARAAATAQVLRGRCLSYGEGITFWPLADIARHAAGIAEDDPADQARAKLDGLLGDDAADAAERLAAVMGLSEVAHPVQETFWAARRLFEVVARSGPVVAVIEDIHWAEPTFLDLVEHVAELGEGVPLLLVCTGRPDLLEARPAWTAQRERVRTVTLRPLSDSESAQVMSNLLGEGALAGEPRSRIIEAAQGNPLFVEQMLSMLVDDGLIRREDSGWVTTGDLGSLTVPPSISALLAARLDRLSSTERAVLERGAVIGQTFYLGAVQHLCLESLRPEVRPSLESAARRELVGPAESTLPGEEAFRFQHLLIRDAAYRGLLKRTRADLHERFADWLEAQALDGFAEPEEVRGYHLEQAFLAVSQLGPPDAHAQAVGERGARYLSSAGEQARARGDMPAAAKLLRRAATIAPDAPECPRWLVHAGEALAEMGEFRTADEVLGGAEQRAQRRDDVALATEAVVVRRTWRYLADPEGTPTSEVSAAGEAIRELERLDAHAGLARTWTLLTNIHFYEGHFGRAQASATNAVREAQLAGDRVLEVRLLSGLACCLVYGPTAVPEALDGCRRILDSASEDRRTTAMTLSWISHLEAMRGDVGSARNHYRRSRELLTELGFTLNAATTSLESGPVEMLAGDLAQAEAELRGDYTVLQAMGEKHYTPTVAGLLAEVLHAQGRDSEAATFADVCRDLADPHDVGAQYQWRCVRAKLLAVQGPSAEAEELAREAVRLIGGTDQPDVQGEALVGLAEVLTAAGKRAEASAALVEAISLFDTKGNSVSAARSRHALERLARPLQAGPGRASEPRSR